MKAWKKGAVVGAIWGFVADIVCLTGPCIVSDLRKTLLLPIYLADLFSREVLGLGFILLIFVYPIAIIIGALIGLMTGLGIEKIREKISVKGGNK